MSVTKEITLWCNHPGCVTWLQLNDAESGGGSVVIARREARRHRWTMDGKNDLCPEHSSYVPKVKPYTTPSITLAELRRQHEESPQ